MGGGSYSYSSARLRADSITSCACSDASYMDREVFTSRSLSEHLDIKSYTKTGLDGKMVLTTTIRESRDSEEHPESFPIIIALDVTGSMGYIPKNLIKDGFPEMMKKIMDEGVQHAQVCFMGIGDAECDSAPIQMGQFETSDELCEQWLKSIYLEGGGGGNTGESYSLAWLAAARHTDIDSFNKRGIKGVLITIGDEPNLPVMYKNNLNECIGGAQADIQSSEILAEAREKWNVFHINVTDWSGCRQSVKDSWGQLLGENLIHTQSDKGTDIPDLIAGIVVKCYNETKSATKSVIAEAVVSEHKPKSKTADELLAEIKEQKS